MKRERNKDNINYLNPNKLAKVRQYVMKEMYLVDTELMEIKSRAECSIRQNRQQTYFQEIDEKQLETEVEGQNTNLSDVGPDNISIYKSNAVESAGDENITEKTLETTQCEEEYSIYENYEWRKN